MERILFKLLLTGASVILSALLAGNTMAGPLGTAFTYQGRLNESGNPATGIYDLRFAICDAASGGNTIAGPLTNSALAVSNGLFTAILDFGPAVFNGDARWLEIAVRAGTSGFAVLAPRQSITPTPYALQAATATSVPTTNLTGSIPDARLSPNVALLNRSASFAGTVAAPAFSGAFTGNGGGLTGVPGTFHWQTASGIVQAQPNNGYLATDAAQVALALPTAPSLGDTVRVSGLGAGGWKLSQNAGQTVLVGNAALMNVGVNWIPRGSYGSWQAISSSADGSRLVAATTGAGWIYTSTDSGTNWARQAQSGNWASVASSADGTKLAAATMSSQLYISADSGTNWTARGPSTNWQSVACSADGTKLVAGCWHGPIYTSSDSGTNWTAHGPSATWSVASSSDGTKLIAAAYATNGQIYISSDSGANWTAHGETTNWSAVATSADGSKLFACLSGGQIYTSVDSGANWAAHGSSANWSALACSADGTKLVAAVWQGQICVSSDSGVTWTPYQTSRYWSSIASSANGTKLIAVAGNDYIYTCTPSPMSATNTTTTGTAGYLVGSQGATAELLYIGSGQFVPLSYGGTIFGY